MTEQVSEDKVIWLYEAGPKLYPRAVHGWFAAWRWLLVAFTQAVFYGLPWLTWNDRPMVLFDLATRRFYLFGLVLWPQDFIYLTGLLVICAYSLFLFTAIAGRLWCGYACPQTVYTEIFMAIEGFFEGNWQKRKKLDSAPWSLEKVARKGGKQLAWIVLALWTGISFVGYFVPIRQLVFELASLSGTAWETFWVGFYAFATWGNAGFMREQVCKYMCPYARFQSAMLDKHSLIISYDDHRGEPRGSRPRKADPKTLAKGDCIDCGLCVAVCPTGIDIRKGLQYECIGCAACIDVCNDVMDKMDYPRGLIRYGTQDAISRGERAINIVKVALRPRILVYTAVLLVLVTAIGVSLMRRTDFKADVIRDRNALGRVYDDGRIENVYRLQLMNTSEQPRKFTISVRGMPGLVLDSEPKVQMQAAQTRFVPLRVQTRATDLPPGSHPIEVLIQADDGSGKEIVERSAFYVPRQ
jgi:cytochrome c oxidase accessory protein FixG